MQFESERAIFKFEESDSDLIQLLADYLDSHVDNIYKFFEVNMPKEKLVVNIIPTKEEFDVLSRIKRNFYERNWFGNMEAQGYF